MVLVDQPPVLIDQPLSPYQRQFTFSLLLFCLALISSVISGFFFLIFWNRPKELGVFRQAVPKEEKKKRNNMWLLEINQE